MSGRRLLTFFVGDERFAASAADVSEVFRAPRITRIPHSPPSLLGIAGLRGAPAPVISLARLLGREAQGGEDQRLLLLAGEPPIGLMVDRVGALTEAPAEATHDPRRKAGLGGLYAADGAAYRLLDLEALLERDFDRATPAARAPIAHGDPQAATEIETTVALLTFDLDAQAYALPLDDVAEVLPAPPRLARVAQSDDAVLGVITLRGAVLPIVSAKALLGLPETGRPEKVVVARIGAARVGLAVDRLRSILRAPASSIDAAPAVLNRGEGEAQVQSICRLPGGGGLVAILSAERLFRDEKVAHILADSRSEDQDMTATDAQTGERVLVFRLVDEEYGLPLAAVDEVARLPERLTRVPRAPAFVEGVLNLRGKVTPIIDQRRRFGAAAGAARGRARIIVTTVEDRQAGFIVDSVSEIVQLAPDQIEATPELAAQAGRLFSRIASLDGGARLILMIEPKELLDRAERDLLAELDASTAETPS